VLNLVPVVAVTSLPVDDNVPTGRPANWLLLYRESAALYCPGLSRRAGRHRRDRER
jgi:hypothetical protein